MLTAQKGYYSEHCTEALLKGDTIARYTAYGLGRQWGFLSVNDIRKKENESPIPGGNQYLVPVNMTPANEPTPKQAEQPPTPPVPAPAVPKPPKKAESVEEKVKWLAGYDIQELMFKAEFPNEFTDWIEIEYGSDRRNTMIAEFCEAGMDQLEAFTFTHKWMSRRREDLNQLADTATPKTLHSDARQLATIWSRGIPQLVEEARSLIQ